MKPIDKGSYYRFSKRRSSHHLRQLLRRLRQPRPPQQHQSHLGAQEKTKRRHPDPSAHSQDQDPLWREFSRQREKEKRSKAVKREGIGQMARVEIERLEEYRARVLAILDSGTFSYDDFNAVFDGFEDAILCADAFRSPVSFRLALALRDEKEYSFFRLREKVGKTVSHLNKSKSSQAAKKRPQEFAKNGGATRSSGQPHARGQNGKGGGPTSK